VTNERVDLLLAEDNASDAELILESLATYNLGDRMFTVRDGEEALDFLFGRGPFVTRAQDPLPRLVLLDVKLPKVSGLDVLAALRADPRTLTVPIVMLTSSNLERDVARAYELGANSYVQKPMDFGRFRDVVRMVGSYWLNTNEPPPITGRRTGST
jgi:two-component system, response regulator